MTRVARPTGKQTTLDQVDYHVAPEDEDTNSPPEIDGLVYVRPKQIRGPQRPRVPKPLAFQLDSLEVGKARLVPKSKLAELEVAIKKAKLRFSEQSGVIEQRGSRRVERKIYTRTFGIMPLPEEHFSQLTPADISRIFKGDASQTTKPVAGDVYACVRRS